MKIKDISVTKGLTVNLGGHQFHKVEVGMTADLDAIDNFDESYEKLVTLVNLRLASEISQATQNTAPRKILTEG